jgi:NodT family efflux transporter outer membrane factor (OMF) lipoprotein
MTAVNGITWRRGVSGAACVLAAAGVVTGCRVKDPPKVADIQQQGMAHIAAPGVWASAPTTPGWVMDGWLQTFGDAQLNALVDEAMAYNTDLRVGAARVEQARLYAKLAGAALYPAVDGMARGGGKVSDGSGLTGGAITVSWELDLWGRIRYGRAAAAADAASSQADYAFARQVIAATVAKSWMLALEARLQLVVASELLDASNKLVTLAETRFNVGVGDELDVAVARANVGAYRDAVRQLELALNHAGRALETVVGRYPSAAMQFGSPLPAFPGDIPAGLPSELLERRPDVIAAERRVAAAFYRVGEAKAARLPRITLTTGVNAISSSLFVLQDRTNPVWSFGAGLLAPIFSGGALKTQVDIRTVQQKQAVAEYAAVGLRAFSDVEEALATELAMRDREQILAAQLVDSQRALDIAQARYDIGAGDLRVVEQRLIALQANRAALLRVQTEQRVQRINLHLALGGSFAITPPKE